MSLTRILVQQLPPLPPSVIVNPTDMAIDESEDETEDSDTCEEFDDGDDMDFFVGQD
ncbi:hypothetical protein RvY_18159 [Ramazzottius varieornatus]|uniref:Uncharacterized protein n=1 Tax=Ramazzottius varieornatus TaxID=947166 RepID=A0A1D1W5A4_RAMVA|nr:hypothetical protein RvY_18159 [Ramazzottius varieornatus]